MRSNCLFFAVALYWRRWLSSRWVRVDGERYFVVWRRDPRCILIRASRLGSLLPHVLYAEARGGRLRVVHFVPLDPKVKILPPPCFRGRLKRGDWQDTQADEP